MLLCHSAAATESGVRGGISAKQGSQCSQEETVGTARSVKLTLSMCSVCRPVPSCARGSHGLQRGKVLGAKSRFSTTAAHPGPLPPLPCFPPLQPCIPSPPISPAHLGPCPGVWLGVPGTCGCTLDFSAPCPVSAPSTPGRSRQCSLGSAPSLPPTSTRVRGVYSEQGATQPSPKPSCILSRSASPTHPALPTPPQAVQHPGTFPLALVLALGKRWPRAPGAHREASNRQQLP